MSNVSQKFSWKFDLLTQEKVVSRIPFLLLREDCQEGRCDSLQTAARGCLVTLPGCLRQHSN